MTDPLEVLNRAKCTQCCDPVIDSVIVQLITALTAALARKPVGEKWKPGDPRCDGCDNGLEPDWVRCPFCDYSASPNNITDADQPFCNGGYTRSRHIACVCGALGDQKCRAKFSDDTNNITHPPPTGCGECGTPPEQVWMQRHSKGCPKGRARPLPIDDEPDHITIRAPK